MFLLSCKDSHESTTILFIKTSHWKMFVRNIPYFSLNCNKRSRNKVNRRFWTKILWIFFFIRHSCIIVLVGIRGFRNTGTCVYCLYRKYWSAIARVYFFYLIFFLLLPVFASNGSWGKKSYFYVDCLCLIYSKLLTIQFRTGTGNACSTS